MPTWKRLAARKEALANSLGQAVLADFISEGHFDRHVRRMRKLYASRAEAFAEAAERHWRGLIRVPEIRAGLDIAVELELDDEAAAHGRIAAAGIDLLPLARYCAVPRAPGLVMGFAPYDEASIQAAAEALGSALRS